jgi:hypothetical protein
MEPPTGISLNQALYDQAVFVGLKAAKSTREFYQINAQLTGASYRACGKCLLSLRNTPKLNGTGQQL